MTNSIAEIGNADCILITGTNTTENHPIIALEIKAAVKHRGAKLIVVDPRKIELTDYATLWLNNKPGTDVALFNGLANIILRNNWHNEEFINTRTENIEEFKASLSKYTPEYVSLITGVPVPDLVEAARIYATSVNSSILYCMGITQHVAGTNGVMSLANLAMITGQIGKENSGINPLRGQNNVQGSCDMGALPNVFSGYQPVDNAIIREKFENAYNVSLSVSKGLTVTEMMQAACKGEIKALYIMGENPLLSDPNTNHIKEAFKNLEFVAVQDIFLTETAEIADVVFPSAVFAEKDGTFTNTERRVQRVRKALNPPGEALPDWQIIARLSNLMGYKMDYSSASDILDEIASVTPSYGGINFTRLDHSSLQWPCPTTDHPGTKFLHKDKFTRGLGKFVAVEYHEPPELPDADYPYILSTGRVLYHYHTGTMTRKSEGLSEICPENLVEINPEDAVKIGIANDDMVKVASRRGEVSVKVKVTDKSPQGVVFMPFHFIESPANVLTSDCLDPVAKIPELKVCAVSVVKV